MIAAADRILLVADLAGTLLFAMEGAIAATAAQLDVLGVMVLAFATALGGGIVRDLLIGATPPASLRDWRYSATAFAGGAVVLFVHSASAAISTRTALMLDAAGLAMFAVAGARKALDHGLPPFVAVLLGGITGVGGGTIRDMMLAQVPVVLRADVYATAALAGAAVMVAARAAGVRRAWPDLLGAAACFALRVLAVMFHWSLPRFS